MTAGTTYKVTGGTLTIRSVPKGKESLYTLWYESLIGNEYSCEVQMGREHLRKLDNMMY